MSFDSEYFKICQYLSKYTKALKAELKQKSPSNEKTMLVIQIPTFKGNPIYSTNEVDEFR